MSLPFRTYDDPEGNLYMMPGVLIAIHSTTTRFTTGATDFPMEEPAAEAYRPAALPRAAFQGGNGRNLRPTTAFPGSLVPDNFFIPTGLNTWAALGNEDLVLTYDPTDGSADIADGTGTVATKPATGTDPGGTYTATNPYGESFNGAAAWSRVLEWEGAAEAWPVRSAVVTFPDIGVQEGIYDATGWGTWESIDDADWTLTLDGTGAGEISDNVDIVATRAADAGRLYDPSGGWESTAYGATTYGATSETTGGAASAGTFPALTFRLVNTTGTVSTFTAIEDPSVYLLHDSADGDAELYDETGLVGERLAGVTTAHPWGTYVATTDGKDRYHGGTAWNYVVATPVGAAFSGEVGLQRALPAEAKLYVKITRDSGTDEATALTGPFWAASLPANTSTAVYWPVAEVNASGVLTQLQIGPIPWRPA